MSHSQTAPVAPTAGQTPTTPAVRGRRTGAVRSVPASIALHTTLILATLIAVFPILWIALASFRPANKVSSTSVLVAPTLENYQKLLFSTNFVTWFGNSLVVALFTMLFGITMSATAGYAISRFNFPGKRSLMWIFLITQMFPVSILIVPIYTIMSALGLINTHLSLVLAYCTIAVSFCTWMLKGYFDSIPTELDEAAQVDGLGPFGTFWRVILPLARPGLVVTAFYTFLTAWGEVAYASAFINTDDRFTLAYGMQMFVPPAPALPHWDLLTSAAVLITLPAAIVFFFAQRHLVTGLTAGSTKG
ncbi:carbohydrate ABC transporter membrane protein 2, CUT1 family [Austwickia chelonae]|uniref:Putative ABC transporter permease protein n=1 Tax=Austwickia chelonae NBRC 105200 TaxID=1184607 RepID=K6VM65_9MICO|nr:sugar ABC transporter permease [Austwickia chelonae]GAB77839.1 putative ABC transporter permease protein [Austwickia chelonae NBRC 105200]SEV90569.1 carbohydrate ABC transporter membrane protein 2, CUT1 family [Austwickia chelonae]